MSVQISEGLRRRIRERDGEKCARCARTLGSFPSSIHHRKPRGMGGTSDPRVNDPRNLVLLCGSGVSGCHGWIESQRSEARALGWLIRSLDDLDTPMIARWGVEIRLGRNGSRVDLWPHGIRPN